MIQLIGIILVILLAILSLVKLYKWQRGVQPTNETNEVAPPKEFIWRRGNWFGRPTTLTKNNEKAEVLAYYYSDDSSIWNAYIVRSKVTPEYTKTWDEYIGRSGTPQGARAMILDELDISPDEVTQQ